MHHVIGPCVHGFVVQMMTLCLFYFSTCIKNMTCSARWKGCAVEEMDKMTRCFFLSTSHMFTKTYLKNDIVLKWQKKKLFFPHLFSECFLSHKFFLLFLLFQKIIIYFVAFTIKEVFFKIIIILIIQYYVSPTLRTTHTSHHTSTRRQSL